MRLFLIYRTAKGNLTFKLQEAIAYSVYARSTEGANVMLKRLKELEKQNKSEE